MSADVKQMYLQVHMHPGDRKMLKLFWRPKPTKPLRVYQLTRVTFGLAPSSYQAKKVMQVLADTYQNEFPTGSKALKRDLYVDDCMTGANSKEEAIKLQQELTELAEKANVSLRKWTSSDPTVLAAIPEHAREMMRELDMDNGDTVKALGLVWSSTEDCFRMSAQQPKAQKVTKRTILSEIARIFHPLGFLSPVTVRAKLLMQRLWKA
ncbi:unnamed protein product [Allacma fusca]|uniref:Reverse transcriptase domain-containing protein n=1 Tax=Allacma fusca TaxID=39272 RepID=A0A8J2JNT6_9HEXA|nr:unnamed protein product [Allacma fusca]